MHTYCTQQHRYTLKQMKKIQNEIKSHNLIQTDRKEGRYTVVKHGIINENVVKKSKEKRKWRAYWSIRLLKRLKASNSIPESTFVACSSAASTG